MTQNTFSRRHLLLLGSASMALAGCAQTQKAVNVFRGGAVAGAQVDEGGFGNPTMQNTQVQNGEIQVLRDLSARFQAEVPTTINFAFNSARIDTAAAAALNQQAAFIRAFPEVRFSVYGHTDAVGSDGFNRSLGERRARAVVNYLVGQGAPRDRLEALVSLGETQPLVPTPNRERTNRRTVTEVAGFASDPPLWLDGNRAQLIYRSYLGGGG